MKRIKKLKSFAKKYIVFLLLGVISFAIGIAIAKMVQNNIPASLKDIMKVPFYIEILIFFISYVVSILFHELAHLISFKIQGLNIRAFLFVFFAFIRDNKKIKFKINIDPILAGGGMVIPNIPSINSYTDFKRIQKIYSKAIITAPIVSGLLGVICIIICFIILPSVNDFNKNILLSFTIWFVFFALLLNVSSLIKTENAYGDYPAYFAYKNDDFFAMFQLYSYLFFMEDSFGKRTNAHFLKKSILDNLIEKSKNLNKYKNDLTSVNALDMILVENIIGREDNIVYILELVNYYIDNPRLLIGPKSTEPHKILFIHILYWMKLNNDTRLVAMIELTKNLFSNKKIQKYYDIQMSQILGTEDHTTYLSNKINIKNTSAYQLYQLFDGYYVDELKLNSLEFTHVNYEKGVK